MRKIRNTKKIVSPISNTNNVIVEHVLDTKVIEDDYKLKYNVDVSRHFKECNGKLSVCLCLDTGYRFYHPFSVAGDGRFYEDVLDQNRYYPQWKKEYQFALAEIQDLSTGAKILDVGCGNGTFLKGLLHLKVEAMGLEYNDAAIQTCKRVGVKVEKESIESFAKENQGMYDVVCAFQVLEHIADVKSFLDACIECLNPGGKLIISVPNNVPYYAGYNLYATANLPPHHMGLWGLEALRKLDDYFPISLANYDYDLPISFLKSVFYRGQFYTNKFFPSSKNRFYGKLISGIISIFFLPFETISQKFVKGQRQGRIITKFNVNH